jgi:hypothetical protein
MSWTKKQLLDAAFTEIGLQNYAYDVEPEDIQNAIVTMDAMVAEWGLNLSYHMSGDPSMSNQQEESGLPIWANKAVYQNLAVEIGPTFGKVIPLSLKVSAKRGLATIQTKCATIPRPQYDPRLPVGQGNKPYIDTTRQFFKPTDPLTDDNGAPLL